VTYRPRVHIQNERFPTLSLCGLAWSKARGGVPASDTTPPVVRDQESGSVNAATCQQCVLQWRRRQLAKS
jgi:hypothetical protein